MLYVRVLAAALAAALCSCSAETGAGSGGRDVASQVHVKVSDAMARLDEGRLNDAFVLLKDAETVIDNAGPEAAAAVPRRDLYLLNVHKANLYTSYRDFAQAAKTYGEAIRHAATAEDSLHLLLDISVVSSHCGDSAAARRAYCGMRALDVPEGMRKRKDYSLAVGRAYMEKFFGDKSESCRLFRRSLAIASDTASRLNVHSRLTPVSELYEYWSDIGDIDSIMHYLRDYERLAYLFRIPDMMADVKQGFLRAYVMQGDRYNALRAYDEYFGIVDSLYDRSGFIALSSKYNDEEMERSNDRILRLEIAVSRQKALISAIAAFLAAVAAVWAGFRYARRSRRRIFFLNREIVRQEAAPSVARGPYAAEAQEDDSGEAAADSADSKGSRHGDLISRIERVLEDPEVYCDPDFSIRSLAALVDSNTKYVSQAINDTSGMNFRTFINTLRVKVARARLAGASGYSNQTIQSVGESVGFRSASNFVIAFKKVMGITPSAYQKLARQNSEEHRL